MARSDAALQRARRAYELAHLAAAARGLALAAVLAAVAFAVHTMTATTWLVAGTLAATLATLAWRGGAFRRGAIAGTLAGLPPLIVPSIVKALQTEHCAACGTVAAWPCTLACFGTSLLVGTLVGFSAHGDASPRRFALAALASASLAGLLGCATSGLAGALGIVVGLAAGGVTGWVVAGRTSYSDV
jgi:hypothetical protein